MASVYHPDDKFARSISAGEMISGGKKSMRSPVAPLRTASAPISSSPRRCCQVTSRDRRSTSMADSSCR